MLGIAQSRLCQYHHPSTTDSDSPTRFKHVAQTFSGHYGYTTSEYNLLNHIHERVSHDIVQQ